MLFELPEFAHMDAHDPKEAVACLRDYGGKAMVVAGATDLLALMKDRIEGPKLQRPEVLLNIKTIPGIARISPAGGQGLTIGAALTLRQLAASDEIHRRYPILSQAALQVGTTQIRNMGTVGGNLCQRPRCAYFRHPHFVCFKKGGSRCYAVAGEHRFYHAIMKIGKCVMAHPSDMAPALVALKAGAVIAGPDGEKRIPLEAFFVGPDNIGETVLTSEEFLLAIELPDGPAGTRQLFLKRGIRRAADFALGSVAAMARISHKVCEEMRIVLGGVAPFPHVAEHAAEMVRGKSLSERRISEAAEAAVQDARPLPMNGYKVDLIKGLVRQALTALRDAPQSAS